MIAQELRSLIEPYLEEKKSRTVQSLSKETGVSYSVVRRILQGEVTDVSLVHCLAILNTVSSKEASVAFLKKHYPLTGTIMEHHIKYEYVENSDSLTSVLDDFECFSALLLAAGRKNGISEDDLKHLLGGKARDTLEQLESSNLVRRLPNGKVTSSIDKYSSNDYNASLQRVQFCHRHLSRKKIGQEKQVVSLISDGVSRDGQKKLYKMFHDFFASVDKVVQENPGEHVIFTNLVLGEIG